MERGHQEEHVECGLLITSPQLTQTGDIHWNSLSKYNCKIGKNTKWDLETV